MPAELPCSVATPLLFSAAEPRLWPAAEKVTVPVGVPLVEVRATVAVRVADWFSSSAVGATASVVAVADWMYA
jgi:hypothetical protein